MGKFRCDGTLFKMSWPIQLATSKDIFQRSNIQKQKKTRKSIKIKRSTCGRSKSNINCDDGNFLKTYSDMVKHELRVKSLKAPVESLKARVKIERCEFKSTSYEFKSTS